MMEYQLMSPWVTAPRTEVPSNSNLGCNPTDRASFCHWHVSILHRHRNCDSIPAPSSGPGRLRRCSERTLLPRPLRPPHFAAPSPMRKIAGQ